MSKLKLYKGYCGEILGCKKENYVIVNSSAFEANKQTNKTNKQTNKLSFDQLHSVLCEIHVIYREGGEGVRSMDCMD